MQTFKVIYIYDMTYFLDRNFLSESIHQTNAYARDGIKVQYANKPVVAEEAFREPRDALRTFTLSSHQHSNKQASQQNQHNANKHILHICWGLWWFWSSDTSNLMYGERREQGACCCSSCNVVSRLEQPNVNRMYHQHAAK